MTLSAPAVRPNCAMTAPVTPTRTPASGIGTPAASSVVWTSIPTPFSRHSTADAVADFSEQGAQRAAPAGGAAVRAVLECARAQQPGGARRLGLDQIQADTSAKRRPVGREQRGGRLDGGHILRRVDRGAARDRALAGVSGRGRRARRSGGCASIRADGTRTTRRRNAHRRACDSRAAGLRVQRGRFRDWGILGTRTLTQ